MSLFQLNLATGMTLILFAAKTFNIYDYSWLTVFTPAILGLGADLGISYLEYKAQQRRRAKLLEGSPLGKLLKKDPPK